MKLPGEALGQAIIYGVLAIVVVAGLWWAGDSIMDMVRAPVQRQLDTAVQANKSVVQANENLILQNQKLGELLLNRSKREDSIDTRLNGIEANMRALKAKSPEVKKWAETPIPPEVLQ